MPPSFLPRHPREEAKPGTNKYKDIVCSGRIWLQHKASCYRGHGYSNRFLPCRGRTTVTLHAQISRVAYTLLGNTPPRLSDTPRPILRLIRGPHRSKVLSARGLGPSPLALRVVVRSGDTSTTLN